MGFPLSRRDGSLEAATSLYLYFKIERRRRVSSAARFDATEYVNLENSTLSPCETD